MKDENFFDINRKRNIFCILEQKQYAAVFF
jgi:hypothetical protein